VIAITVLSISAIGDVLERSVGGGRSHGGLPRAHRRHGALIARPAVAAGAAARDGAAILSVRGLTVAIDRDGGAVPLVSDVNLEVHAGEIVGLVGESGAGKSVTARTTLGILPRGAVASGSILVGGTEVIGASERVLQSLRGTRIAYISQEPMASLSPSFRIGNQLAELVRAHTRVSRRAARERALELLRAVQIPDPAVVARLYPHQVSGGMAQRVMIAIALSGDPDVLVADEPTTALDVSVQMQILDLIRRLQEERDLAVLLVTHDWGVVADVCDRAVAMYAGEIVEEAPVADIFARPLHPYSIALRASDPHLQDRGERLATIPGAVPPPGAWPHGCRFAARCAYATDACRAAPIPLLSEAGSRAVRCIRVDTVVEDVRG
jgi:peptide/nickel transport system permease protein